MTRILVTGSNGLIGAALTSRLRMDGHEIRGYDLAAEKGEDVLDPDALAAAMSGCSGVVHLAAVSRVVSGERDPHTCRLVNVDGTRNVLAAATSVGISPPWILFGSSREVYGQASSFPVPEYAELAPLNCYARSKRDAESHVLAARAAGLNTAVVRFSTVYGSTADHPDRVAPSFARLAVEGGLLRVDGRDTTLDLTHLSDVVDALSRAVGCLERGRRLPTFHLVSGQPTSLFELASLAIAHGHGGRIEIADARDYDVRTFVGDPENAARILGWQATTGVREGMARLVADFSAVLDVSTNR